MASIFDIGKSGLQSYRQALSVTGQNIANINTEGYKRREASLVEISGSSGGITSLPSQNGLGVRIDQVRRSFDEFLLNKARNATAYAETSASFVNGLAQLEDILLPGNSNLGTVIGGFFDGLQEVSASPGDMAPRVLVIEQGKHLAETFRQLDVVIQDLKDGLHTKAKQDQGDLNALLSELANVNRQITSSGSSVANNALLDNRDRIIDRISKLAEVSVTLSDKGAANLTLGSTGRGPALVEGNRAFALEIENTGALMQFLVGSDKGLLPTNQMTNGSFKGLAAAFATASKTLEDLDALAYSITQAFNRIHRQGIDLEGNAGGDLFRTQAPLLQASLSNMGSAIAEAGVLDFDLIAADEITLTYNASASVWIARNSLNQEISRGREKVQLPGLDIMISGQAKDGDQFTFSPAAGMAGEMALNITRAQELAAAATTQIFADSDNISAAEIEASKADPLAASSLPEIGQLFANASSAIGARQFLVDGSVGVVPKNIENIDLFSLASQAGIDFYASQSEMSAAQSLSFVTRSTVNNNQVDESHSFTLNPSQFSGSSSWQDFGQIADLLNAGVLRSAAGKSLAELGGYAAGSAGQLTLSFAEVEVTGDALLGTGSGQMVTGLLSGREETISDIQIFTREGRHIAGTALSATEIANLITADNGFLAEAAYNSDRLNLTGDAGYKGIGLARADSASDILIASSGSGHQRTLDFTFLEGIDTDEAHPQGELASAAAVSYTVSLGGLIEASITTSAINGQDGAAVARAMADALRASAPIATMAGAATLQRTDTITLSQEQQNSLAADGQVSVSDGGIIYQISSSDGIYTVTSGIKDQISLTYDAVNTRIESVVPDLPVEEDSVWISFEGAFYQLTRKGDEIEITGGEEGRLSAYFDTNYRLQILSNSGSLSASSLALASDADIAGNSSNARRFGLIDGVTQPTVSNTVQDVNFAGLGVDFDISLNGAQLVVTHSDSNADMQVTTMAKSLAGQRVTLTDLPDEELLVMVTGGGARRLAMTYDQLPEGTLQLPRDLQVKVTDSANRTVEFIDTETGTSIATRTLDANGRTSGAGYDVRLRGELETNDKFHITSNAGGRGDARNVQAMIDLQLNQTVGADRGNFQEMFSAMVSELGTKLQANELTYEAASALRDASLEAESAYSGVNLDTEASKLIEQQQAYQASARILATARELFDTLFQNL